ncbi:MAG: hypothetical protein KDG50_06000 [Chromatiales bacterium]|nr:hypothetical protein [Chromatiales bacterium]
MRNSRSPLLVLATLVCGSVRAADVIVPPPATSVPSDNPLALGLAALAALLIGLSFLRNRRR